MNVKTDKFDIFDDDDLDDDFDSILDVPLKTSNQTVEISDDDDEDDLSESLPYKELEDNLDEDDFIEDDEEDLELSSQSIIESSDDDLDEEDTELDFLVNRMLEDSNILTDNDDLVDDLEYAEDDDVEPVTIESGKGNSLEIVDKTKFTFAVNKNMSTKELRSLQIMKDSHAKLAGKSEGYRIYNRNDLMDIIRNNQIVNIKTGELIELTPNQIKMATNYVNNVIKDMKDHLELIAKVYNSVEQGVKTNFRNRGSHSPYRNMELSDKEAALALNDLMRVFLMGDTTDFNNIPKIDIPPEHSELKDKVLYDIFRLTTSSDEYAFRKTICLVDFFTARKNLTREDYKTIKYYELFNDNRPMYHTIQDHYNTIRDAIIKLHDTREKEKYEIARVLDLKLRQTIPAESKFYIEHIDLFESLAANKPNYYTSIIINDFCYVEKICHSKEHKTFICGNCGEENIEENEFIKFMYLRSETGDGTLKQPIMGINQCKSCGKYNTLSGVQINMFKTLHKSRNPSDADITSILQSYSKEPFGTLTPSVDMFEAVLQESFSTETAEDFIIDETLIIDDESSDNAQESIDSASNISPINIAYIKALQDYRELISMFRTTTTKPVKVKDSLEECKATYAHINSDRDVKLGKPRIEYFDVNILPDASELEEAIKVVCTIVGYDYMTQRRNATLSLINYFINSPLHNAFDINIIKERRIAFDTRDNLKELYERGKRKTEDMNEVYDILKQRAYLFDLDSTLPVEKLYEAYMNIPESLLETKEKEANDLIDVVLKNIFINANLYAHVPISNIETLLNANIFSYISNKKVWDMIDYISGLMVLNAMSEPIFVERVLKILTDNTARRRLEDQIGTENKPLPDAILALLNLPTIPKVELEIFQEECMGVTSAAKQVYIEDLIHVSKLVTSVINQDIFSFYVSVDACLGFLDSNTKEVKDLRPIIEKYKDEAEAFVDKNGFEDYDRIVYYLRLLFDESEIDYSLININKMLKYSILPDRKENEEFKDYIERCNSEELQPLMSIDTEIFNDIMKYLPYLLGLKSFATFMTTNVHNVEVFLAGSEFIRMSLRNKSLYWKELLRLSEKNVNSIANALEDFDIYKHTNVRVPSDDELYLINSFYPTYDLNKNVLLVDKNWKVIPEYSEVNVSVDLVNEQRKLLHELEENPESVYVSPKIKEIVNNERG